MFESIITREAQEMIFNPFLIVGALFTVTIIHSRYGRVGIYGILVGALIGSILGRLANDSYDYYQRAFFTGLVYSWIFATYFWMRRTG